jgi:hypothetical protein
MAELLVDPTVQKWQKEQGLPKAKAVPANEKSDEAVSRYFDTRPRETHEHAAALADALMISARVEWG